MRPVNRGQAPKVYTSYRDAIGDLEKRLGNYCSYCETRFRVGLAVEHVSPKSLDSTRRNDWDNFLLGCPNCNSLKGDMATNSTDFVWPDKDNTLLAIEYLEGGIVKVGKNLSPENRKRAQNLIDLVGLDRHPGQSVRKKPALRDNRYSEREEVWATASRMRVGLFDCDCESYREAIVSCAKGWGFFGVWMSVFFDDSDMRQRFIKAFAGTAVECFDTKCNCVPRLGGHT